MLIDPRDTQTWTLLSQTTRAERILLAVLARFAPPLAGRPDSALVGPRRSRRRRTG